MLPCENQNNEQTQQKKKLKKKLHSKRTTKTYGIDFIQFEQ